ncbi:MAG: TetR/AcrR family transcriptional regulator [Pseudomonadota bacterium]
MVSPKRAETERKLVNALGEVLAEQGFSNVGVNSVARKAGVDKVLIYRYFGGLDGLTKAFAECAEFWPSLDELLGSAAEFEQLQAKPFADQIAEIFERYVSSIRKRQLTLEIMAWESVERNALTIELENVREARAIEIQTILRDAAKQNNSQEEKTNRPESTTDEQAIDWQAVTTLFSAATHYLAIRARHIKTYNAMDLSTDDGWARIVRTMKVLITGMGE